MNTQIRLYTPEEVAAILQVTRRTVYSYIKAGRLSALKIGRNVRIPEDRLEQFIQGNQQN